MPFPAHLLQLIPPTTPLPRLALHPAALRQIQTIADDLRSPAPHIATTALFSACDSTSAALAAEALAHTLGRDLLRINLAAVISTYIGEAEKRLRELFAATDPARAILFFDEADALFGKRTEIREAHDRYHGLDVDSLLGWLQAFPGLAILASTSRTSFKPGVFIRYTIHLPHIPEASGPQPA